MHPLSEKLGLQGSNTPRRSNIGDTLVPISMPSKGINTIIDLIAVETYGPISVWIISNKRQTEW